MFTALLERVRGWMGEPKAAPPLRVSVAPPAAVRPLTVLPLLAHAPAIVALQRDVADLKTQVLRLEEAEQQRRDAALALWLPEELPR